MRSFAIALFVVLTCISMASQAVQGPTTFTGTNNQQIVNILQGGRGFALVTRTPSNAPSVYGQASATNGFTFGLWGDVFSNQGTGVRGESHASSEGAGLVGITHGNTFNLGDGSGVGVHGLAQEAEGTTSSGQAIAVLGTVRRGIGGIGVMGQVSNGNAGLFLNESAGRGNILVGQTRFFGQRRNVFRVDTFGNVFVSALFFRGADFAESVAVNGNKSRYSAGDVLVIDSSAEKQLARTKHAYSTRVAGVYSTRPGLVAGSALDKSNTEDVPLAVVGIVPCKVTALNGTIRPGDLLVTSPRPGYAMKGTDSRRMTGAVLGKALQPLPKGEGVIQVLVTLH